MFNYWLLISLGGLAANLEAHPTAPQTGETGVSSRSVDLNQFRLVESSHYIPAAKAKADNSILRINKKEDYLETAKALVKAVAPHAEYRLVNDHYIGSEGIAHVYFKQTVHGIDIDNGDFNVNIGKDGKVFSYGNSFFDGDKPKDSPLQKRGFSDPAAALKGVIKTLSLGISTDNLKVEPKEGKEHYILAGTTGTLSKPEAKLTYLRKKDGLALAWRIETDIGDNWLLSYADAHQPDQIHSVVDYVSELATYQVYPWTVNDPTEGSRTIIQDPWNLAASPFTWISDGQQNYTTTAGNNAVAQDNPTGGDEWSNNHRPNSPNLKFEYPYSPSTSNPKSYRDASITQLFYTANKYHDLLYILGFTEEAGNFQQNNNGKGGAGGDFVILNSQDGSGTNNANFASPPDGQSGRMRMYLWTLSNPQRDGCFDANVVLHEYTHGLSTRLTGGPNNGACLNGLESGGMGEGWSDFMALAIRLKATDNRSKNLAVGAWVSNKPQGIRQYPYSTNMQVNPMTYGTVNQQNEVHAIGTVWCTVLYEAIWNLIEKHGITNSDLPEFDANGVPKDGRYLAMKIVMSGMAIQPCDPNMVQARDAIIDADKSLTSGSNQCELWKAFAKRGLGENAQYDENYRQEDFTVPQGVCSS